MAQQVHPAHQVNGHAPLAVHNKITSGHISSLNESIWLGIGSVYELQGEADEAVRAYEHALQHNNYSIQALNNISCILRAKEAYPRATECLQTILKIDSTNGEVWGSLGHCHLMMENLQEAYQAYQQALYHLRDPKEPKLWYGIGILYDRYGSLDHAEEAFAQVMKMAPGFEKANEIYFRLGIIYKQQQKYYHSLECFKFIVKSPPRPLTEEDIWFQIGHVHEQQKDFEGAKLAYRRVLEHDPQHARVLQQLGWLYHQESNDPRIQDQAVDYLEKSVRSDPQDAQSWYLLGRCHMALNKYKQAYENYQQAVYRDGRNPSFWCSIGVLYYKINQYRDALDAYSRAIRLNPYISEVWYDLGTLYESCHNQTNDALDAYQRAFDLDPTNQHIKNRLQLLRSGGQTAGLPNAAPVPQDVHPQQYQAPGVGAPPGPQWDPQQGSAQPPVAPAPFQQVGTAAAGQPLPPPHQQQPQPLHQHPGHGPPQIQAPPPMNQDWNPHMAEAAPNLPHTQQAPAVPFYRNEPPRNHAQRAPTPGRYEPGRPNVEPAHDGGPQHSPVNQALPLPAVNYGTQQGLPQPQGSILLPHGSDPGRLATAGFPGQHTGVHFPSNAPGHSGGPAAPYGRGSSPPPEIKPLGDPRPLSPSHRNVAHNYPAPPMRENATLPLAEAIGREQDNRHMIAPVQVGTKRPRENDDHDGRAPPSFKYAANGENRSRLDDSSHRRASPPDHVSPRTKVEPLGLNATNNGPHTFAPRPENHETIASSAKDAPDHDGDKLASMGPIQHTNPASTGSSKKVVLPSMGQIPYSNMPETAPAPLVKSAGPAQPAVVSKKTSVPVSSEANEQPAVSAVLAQTLPTDPKTKTSTHSTVALSSKGPVAGIKEAPIEARTTVAASSDYEAAARKVQVDEDYDDQDEGPTTTVPRVASGPAKDNEDKPATAQTQEQQNGKPTPPTTPLAAVTAATGPAVTTSAPSGPPIVDGQTAKQTEAIPAPAPAVAASTETAATRNITPPKTLATSTVVPISSGLLKQEATIGGAENTGVTANAVATATATAVEAEG